MAASSYATLAELKAYLTPVGTASDALLTSLLLAASRGLDDFCQRVFYSDGASTKYFDGDGSKELVIRHWDFYTLTALKIATGENTDPATWTALTGDGVTPPSNFYLGPDNQFPAGAVGDQTAKRPWYTITLPTTSTGSGMTYFTDGLRTVSITASWGWPQIPDDIKDLTIKSALRLWRARDAGFVGQQGAPEIGIVDVTRILDGNDLARLSNYRKWDARLPT